MDKSKLTAEEFDLLGEYEKRGNEIDDAYEEIGDLSELIVAQAKIIVNQREEIDRMKPFKMRGIIGCQEDGK
jgi:hypothetical protein